MCPPWDGSSAVRCWSFGMACLGRCPEPARQHRHGLEHGEMQAIFDRWAQRRSGAVAPELIGRIAPTRTEGINMRGIFRFPIEAVRRSVAALLGPLQDSYFKAVILHWRPRHSHILWGNSNSNIFIELRETAQKHPGIIGCFYRMLLHQNQGNPLRILRKSAISEAADRPQGCWPALHGRPGGFDRLLI